VLAVTNSPAKAGIVGFAQTVPYPLLVLPAGVGVDRWNRRRVMIVSDVVRTLALASLAVAIAFDRLTFTQIVVVALVEGTMFAFFNVAELGALRSVVPVPELPAAAAVEQARVSAVILGGPPLGGFLFGIGRALPFLVDAVSYTFSLVSVLAMRTPFQEERERDYGAVADAGARRIALQRRPQRQRCEPEPHQAYRCTRRQRLQGASRIAQLQPGRAGPLDFADRVWSNDLVN
jgi:MFS family permease